jgi:hypothetical protein
MKYYLHKDLLNSRYHVTQSFQPTEAWNFQKLVRIIIQDRLAPKECNTHIPPSVKFLASLAAKSLPCPEVKSVQYRPSPSEPSQYPQFKLRLTSRN